MGFRFRKVINNGPLRSTWTGKGMGWSVGLAGFRYGIASDGRHYISVRIPGSGLYYTKYLNGRLQR